MDNTMIVPKTLNNTWPIAVRLAEMLVPIEASIEVMQVPILSPNILGIAEDKFRSPTDANAITMPIVALELWAIKVTSMPAKTPRIGFLLKLMKKCFAVSLLAKGFTTDIIILSPKNRRPNPNIKRPKFFQNLLLTNIFMKKPTPIAGRA